MSDDRAAAVIADLRERGLTVATCESLTGGLVSAALTSVPGASDVVRGGLVVYATDLKSSLGGVPAEVLEQHGPVAAETVAAMASGVCGRVGSDVGLATTGVAGPDDQDGHPPGTVHVAVALGPDVTVRSFKGADRLAGDRSAIRATTVDAALDLLAEIISG